MKRDRSDVDDVEAGDGADVARRASRSRGAEASSSSSVVSVIMPCRNAHPWLSACVRSVLTQRRARVELIVGDDGSTDGTLEWLRACEKALRERRREEDGVDDGDDEDAAEATATDGSKAFDSASLTGVSEEMTTYTPDEVARCASRGCTLRVLAIDRSGTASPSGQGLALNACFSASTGEYVGEMESDDLRSPYAFAALKEALDANPAWDAVTSHLELCGAEREGMRRFEAFQNGLATPEDQREARFIEIPALRATGLYRRSALERLRATCSPNEALYRDLWLTTEGTVVDFGARADGRPLPGARPQHWWPVDSDFWHRWFESGLVVGRVPRPLYLWRQYDAQSTRTHSRCSLERLRRCKAHFFIRAALAGDFPRRDASIPIDEIRLYGVGATLDAWTADLRDEITHAAVAAVPPGRSLTVVPIPHKPGSARWSAEDARPNVVHAFAFGMPGPRAKVLRAIARSFKSITDDGFIRVFIA